MKKVTKNIVNSKLIWGGELVNSYKIIDNEIIRL